ncbi:MAG: FAD-dependent oxidoreductase [Coriobacteriales bacterium]|jgi:fumarate reductase flavoprotein subunit|nr:FAD-dependent oxidoreductase [Coriobacteriales bacterium]
MNTKYSNDTTDKQQPEPTVSEPDTTGQQAGTAGEGLSRRMFLGLGGAAAVAAGAGLIGCSPTTSGPSGGSSGTASSGTTQGPTAPSKIDASYDTDLLIIGGGGSGLACAVQASLDGTSCILIEKSTVLGGNANFVEGMFAIDSAMAQEQGIHVTAAQIVEGELVRGQYRQNAAFWLDLCEKSAGNIAWCIEQGVLYSGVIDDYHGGLFPTFHWFKDGKASVGYVPPMIKRVEDLGIKVHFDTAATMLKLENGNIAGAYATSADEGTVEYNAKAVVLATGGFGGNAEYIAEQGWNTEHLFIVGSSNAAGDAYRMARDIGAKGFIQDSSQSILYMVPALPNIDFHNDALNPVNGYFGLAAGGPVLWVNENCQRYTRENLTDDNLVLQCIPGKDNLANYVVFDQAILDTYFATTDDAKSLFNDALAKDSTGTLIKADTLDELAMAFNLNSEGFAATVKRYNDLCKAGSDDDLGKPAAKMVAIENGPFYIARLGYSFFFETGGVTTDIQRRVLDEKKQPIPGLYAIGNDGNMNYRHVYTINMPGTAMGNQVNSGREAAINAKVYLQG